MLEHLERADRHTELLADLQIVDRQFMHGAHHADRFGGERGNRRVDDLPHQRHAVFRVAEHHRRRNLDIVEDHVRRALAVLGRVASPRDARSTGVYDEHADAAFLVRPAGGARCHNDAIGAVAMQHDRLCAGKDVCVARLFRGRLDMVEVVARLALGMAEGKLQRSVCDCRHEFTALVVIAAKPHEAAAQHGRGEIWLERQRPAERFHHDHRLDGTAAETAIIFGKG